MRDYTRLDAFLDDREKEVYSEPPGGGDEIISKMVPELISHYDIQPSAKVLDVGCGKGFALEKFRDHGCETVGITLGEDAGHCRANGFKIFEADMSFLNLEEDDFDVDDDVVIESSPYTCLSNLTTTSFSRLRWSATATTRLSPPYKALNPSYDCDHIFCSL